MAGYVYMLASKNDGTLYVGVTSDLGSRVWQHKQQTTPGFTARHGAIRLVWYREFYESATPSCSKSASRNGAAHGKSR